MSPIVSCRVNKAAVEAADQDLEDGGRRLALGELALLYRKTGRTAEAADYERRAMSAPRAEDEDYAKLFTSEVTLAPAATGGAPAPGAAAPAPPVAAVQPPTNAALDQAARSLQQQLESLMRSAQQGQVAQMMPMLGACEGGACATPGDPSQRSAFVLRLAGVTGHLGAALAGAGQVDPQATALNAAGVRQSVAGNLEAARAEWTKALRANPRPQTSAAVQSNLGVVAAVQGRSEEGRARLQAALQGYTALANAGRGTSDALGAKGMAGVAPDKFGVMMEGAAGDSGLLLVLLNLANLEAHLGRHDAADAWLRQAGDHARRDQAGGSALVLGERAAIERLRGRKDAAEDNLRRAQSGTAPNEAWQQIEVGYLSLPAAPTRGTSPGDSSPRPAAPAAPTAPAPRAPVSTKPAEDTTAPVAAVSEAVHARLAADAAEREKAGDAAGALTLYSRAAITAAAANNAERERSAWIAQQRLRAARGDAASSIFHGKRVVNAVQRQRLSLAQLEPAARRAFLDGRKQGYVLLAQTLIERDRLAEAELVLRLLKEDEGQQLEQSPGERGSVPLSTSETSAQQAYDLLAERIRPLEARRAILANGIAVDGTLDSRAAIERARLRSVNRTEEAVDGLFANASEVEAEASACRGAMAKPRRTAAETARLSECALALSTYSQLLERGSEGVRGLKRDLPRFSVRPAEVELRQIDTLLRRFTELQSRMASTLALARQLPAPPPADQRVALSLFATSLEIGRLQELWNLQLEMDELADRVVGVDVSLDAKPGPPEFTAAATVALETGQRLLKSLPAGTVALCFRTTRSQAVTRPSWPCCSVPSTSWPFFRAARRPRFFLQSGRTGPTDCWTDARPAARQSRTVRGRPQFLR